MRTTTTTTTTLKRDGHGTWKMQVREAGCQEDAGGTQEGRREGGDIVLCMDIHYGPLV